MQITSSSAQEPAGARHATVRRLVAILLLGLAVAGCDKCTNLFSPSKSAAPGACSDDAPKH